MGKFKGRKILGVMVFCFVFSVVHSMSVAAIRNNLSVVVPSLQPASSPVTDQYIVESHPFVTLVKPAGASMQATFSSIHKNKKIRSSGVIQRLAISPSFVLNSPFPIGCTIFGVVCIFGCSLLFGRLARLGSRTRFLLLSLLLIAFTKNGQAQSQTFSSSGTFTPPPGVSSVTVELWGGGGGGAAVNGPAGGGGGGAYAKGVLSGLAPGTPIALTVGAGGAAGFNGGDSQMGSIIANGGTAGNMGSGGAGGAASVIGGIVIASFAGGAGGNAMDPTSGLDNEGGGGGGGSATGIANGAVGATAASATGGAGGTGMGNGGRGADGDGIIDAVAGSLPGGGGGRKR